MSMHRMKYKGKSLKLVEFGAAPVSVDQDFPAPVGNEVLMKVTAAGVCHSDLYILDGYQDMGDGVRMQFADTGMPMPLTMGHEIAGEVVAVGPDGDQALVGKTRLIHPWIGCGTCIACADGNENHCEAPRTLGIWRDGGYSDYVLVPDTKYLVEIDGLDPAWASTLACSGLTVYSALKQLQPIKAGSAIAIIGMGGLGLTAVTVAKALGFDKVVACDIADDRLKVARELGASDTINTSDGDAHQLLSKAAGGALFGVVDTVGYPATMELAINATMKGGRIVLIGLQGGSMGLSLPVLPYKALSLIGTYTGSLSELEELIVLAKSDKIQPLPINVMPMACLHETLEELRAGKIVGRVVLDPRL